MARELKLRREFPATLLIALGVAACSHSDGPRVEVGGGDAGGLARAQPVVERFDAAALERASTDPAAQALRAFIVMRHEHIVFERYGHGIDARSVLDLGGFVRALTALAAGIAVHDDLFPLPARSGFDPAQLRASIESGSQQRYADYLSINLWRPLNAAPAWISVTAAGAPIPADCCFHAQLMDWMRVAGLLAQEGRFEGRQLVTPDWIARMRRATTADGKRGFGVELSSAAQGAEAFEADDVFFLRGPGHWRLWLVPSLQLAVLFGAQDNQPAANSAAWDETRLPNLVIRALSERPSRADNATKLQQLVPGH
jgi:CubicO group peptidase (beta-lactamase class C family)